MATDVSPGRRAAALLAFALTFAVIDVAVAIAVHAALGEAGGWVYRTGALVHGLGSMVFGFVLGLPYARAPERAGALALSSAAAGVLLALHALAYQIHAKGGHLPTGAGLTIAASSAEGVTLLGRSLGIAAIGVVLLHLLAPRFARRLEPREAKRAGRIADFVTLGLLSTMWLATVLRSDGPLYYGATPPVLHLAFGAPQAAVDAPGMTLARHVHNHQRGREHAHDDHAGHAHDLASTLPADPAPPDGIPRPPPDVRALLQQLLQSDPPRTVPDPSYPFCRDDRLDPAAVAKRSVVLVDLSGASTGALADGAGTGALARLADEAPSFREVRAPATTALPGLGAALSGVPALVDLGPLVAIGLPPVPRLPGIAADLREAGFRTAAFDSSPLAHGGRGALLRVVGFEHVEGPTLAPNAPNVGGGRPDAATVDSFLGWVRDARRAGAERPYLALVALRGEGEGAGRFDAQLERLLDWHRTTETERGTILVVFSDHAGVPAEDARTARYDVPLIFAGLTEAEAARAREVARRSGGLHDLPQTLLALLGSEFRGCHQGVDLLQPDDRWPDRRVVLSFFGERQETLVAQDGDHLWILPRESDRASLYNSVEDPERADDLWSESDSDWGQMRELRDAYVAVMAYLRSHDRFVPPAPATVPAEAPARAPRAPVRVAGIAFEEALPAAERIEAALRAGFARVRVPVAMNGEGVVVATGGGEGGAEPLAGLVARFGRRIELELVLGEVGTSADPARGYDELRAVTAAARSSRGAKVRLSTVSAGVAFALAEGTDLPVGLELGALRRAPVWLDFARTLGVGFVTASMPESPAGLVERARLRGLEIQLEATADASPSTRAAAEVADAITEKAAPPR